MSAWWYTYPSEKYEFVSWDQNSHVPNHQPDLFFLFFCHDIFINLQPVRNVRGSMRVIQAVVFAKGVPTQLLSVP